MVKILGINKRGNNVQIAERLKVSENDIKNLQKNKIRYLYNKTSGEVSKINISDKPLLLRKFGIKKINNKLITGGNIKKDVVVFKSPISLNSKLTGTLSANVNAIWESSGHSLFKFDKLYFIVINKQILQDEQNVRQMFVNKLIAEYPIVNNEEVSISVKDINFQSNEQIKLKITNMKLKGSPLDITSIYGENVELNITKDNCVREYIMKNYHKEGKGIGKKQVEKLGNENGVDTEEIFNFAVNNNIKMVIFDITGNVIKSYYPEKKNKKFKSLVGIAYNNHFYPLKNSELHRIPNKKIENNIYCEKINDKLIEIIKDGKYPSKVSMSSEFINNIQVDDTVYHCNEDYSFCNKVLNKLGLGDKMSHYVNKINIADIIEKLFIKQNIESYFPYNSNESGYSFFNEEIESEVYTTIDHNKHYSDALRRLNKLIVIDIKTAEHIENPTELSIDYFYIATPKYSNILMPRTGFYSYDFLTYCKNEGVEFTLKEAIKCEYKDNFFNDMINTLYTKLGKDFKEVVNCMIGKFEKKGEEKQCTEFVKIANKDETEASEGFVKKLNNNYNLIYKIINTINTKLNNRVPIRVQALCEARKIVYEKMKELKLTGDSIKQIRTDAITFIGDKKVSSSNEIGEWKVQECKFYKSSPEIIDIELSFKLEPINKNNCLWVDYAGSGKTHYIINELIPTLDNYIVLSPSHASIKEYRSKKINCNVIQKYVFSGELPSENNIIIDEIGMLDIQANNILIKCALFGKNIYSFGDFGQLKPVTSEICNSSIYLNYLYGNIKSLGTNFRNHFTKEYYDELKGLDDISSIINEINKYNTDKYYDAQTIICYKNTTKEKYNEMMIKHLNIKFGDIGCKIVCKTNDLRDKGLYNNFYYTIVDTNVIYDGIEKITLTTQELNKYFELGYCRTLYNIQGESIKNFYFCKEDIHFMNGRALYTLISRLKTK